MPALQAKNGSCQLLVDDTLSVAGAVADAVAVRQALNECLPKNQGTVNVGKILIVGTDGNITFADMPEGGASGNIIGTLDDSNNILLTGSLSDGTYTLKYENTDGTYTDIGTLEVGEIEPDTPAYTNLLPLATNADGSEFVGDNGEDGYKSGYRIKGSTGAEEVLSNEWCTGFMPATYYDTIRIKNITTRTDNASYNMCVFYDSDYNTVYAISIDNWPVDDEGVHSFAAESSTAVNNMAYFRFCCGGITNETIVTVNEEIV